MAIKNLKSANFKNKKVLLRVDINEPLRHGRLEDDFRIQKIIPTIQLLRNRNCTIFILGHLGRPDGHWDAEYSLKPVAHRIAELLNFKFVEAKDKLPTYPIPHVVLFTGKITDPKVRMQLENATSRDIIILENIRYYSEELKNSAFFGKQLAELGEVYVNEAFPVSHRKESSVTAVPKYIPAYAGIVLAQELAALSTVLAKPKHPFVLLMGGIKITDKAKTLENLGKHVDTILLGGGIANTLLAEKGYEIGASIVEPGSRAIAKSILRNLKNKIILPIDVVVSNKKRDPSATRVVPITAVHKSDVIYDIGPKTILEYSKAIRKAKMLVWNGPMGLFEQKPFHTGTMALAKVVGGVGKGSCYTVVGGGETVDAMRQAVQADYVDHLSTGGGAMLEFLAGKKLPGLEVLQ
jgi:phosphoglycerate kinase